jgi:hypothetical protein
MRKFAHMTEPGVAENDAHPLAFASGAEHGHEAPRVSTLPEAPSQDGRLLGQDVVMRGALSTDGTLLATMVDSHFDHAQFQGPGGAELRPKAIYERHGKWYEILADGTPAWHVVFVRPDGTRDPAGVDFARHGSASIVYFAPSTPVHAIDLGDSAGRVVGTVRPTLQAEQE